MSQEIRNKAYLVASGVFGVLLIVGIVDQAQQDVGLDLVERGLDIVDSVIGLVVALGAWWKSRPKAVTVVGVPKAEVAIATPGSQPDEVRLERADGGVVSAPVA